MLRVPVLRMEMGGELVEMTGELLKGTDTTITVVESAILAIIVSDAFTLGTASRKLKLALVPLSETFEVRTRAF